MEIEEIVQGLEEERACFVKYSYKAVKKLYERKQDFPRGIPRIHIIQEIR